MKLLILIPAADRHEAVFRGITAAASLKRQLNMEMNNGRDARFPRHHCRGLIEALTVPLGIYIHQRVFRGITAAASLKPYGDELKAKGASEAFSAASLPRPH